MKIIKNAAPETHIPQTCKPYFKYICKLLIVIKWQKALR